ncbi:MAG: deoxyribodipyrimidine photolyase [Sphingobacteriales bacterium]|nr:MAG: deoxyribodipyrimidine photolyase [Sphingobacteriales bacterium]
MNEFPADYQSIVERIHAIDPVQYSKTRNFTNGAVTYLSPYISRGIISVKQVKDYVVSKGYKKYQIEKFLQELAWREYWQRVWQSKGNAILTDLKYPQQEVAHHQMITNILLANTGIESIDKHIQQLYQTGYMHNHLRMYVAAICCNMGKAHWVLPSQWMYYHLLDGDIASNSLSWQWVAGSFSSKKYYCNQENINKYTFSNQHNTFLDKTYDTLVTTGIPGELQETNELKLITNLPKNQAPDIDINKPTLIYNSYNLDPNWRKEEDANRVLLLEPSHFTQYPVSDKVIRFIIELSKNIPGIQIFTGEFDDLEGLYTAQNKAGCFVFKEHPAFMHYNGIKDERDWMFPSVTGYFPSFSSFWKKAERLL